MESSQSGSYFYFVMNLNHPREIRQGSDNTLAQAVID
jgi:hypothetical protein